MSQALRFYIFFIALLTVHGDPKVWRLPNDSQVNTRIVGGSVISPEKVPFISANYFFVLGFTVFNCGGVILTPTCVITAAHCIHDMNTSVIWFNAGLPQRINILTRSKDSNVEAMFMHPHYKGNQTNDGDLAIVKLKHPLTARNVRPAEIDFTELKVGDELTIYGFGRAKYKEKVRNKYLRTVKVFNTPLDKCRIHYAKDHKVNITALQFCTSVPGGGKDSCIGDSGGPIMRNGKLVGIVSYGYKCAIARFPGVNTRFSHPEIRNFIESIKNEHCTTT